MRVLMKSFKACIIHHVAKKEDRAHRELEHTVTPLEDDKKVEEEERRNGRNSHAASPNFNQSSAKSRLPRIICSPKRYNSPSCSRFSAGFIFSDHQIRSQRVSTAKNCQEAQQRRAHRILQWHPGRHCQGLAQGVQEDEEAIAGRPVRRRRQAVIRGTVPRCAAKSGGHEGG